MYSRFVELSVTIHSGCTAGLRAVRHPRTSVCCARHYVPHGAASIFSQAGQKQCAAWPRGVHTKLNCVDQMEAPERVKQADMRDGQVLFIGEGLAIIQGLNNDAPIGTLLNFADGNLGVLIWRRDDNACFALLLGTNDTVAVGDSVSCVTRDPLQEFDATASSTTQREWELARVTIDDALVGSVSNWQGFLQDSGHVGSAEDLVPLINSQLDMAEREQINEALTTGLRGVDLLTPLGRGQAQLLTGPPSSGKTLAAVDMILGQARSGVRCVYACIGQPEAGTQDALRRLEAGSAMAYTTVVAAPQGASLGQQYGALCAALSLGERTRDAGGHALVILDDVTCMPKLWERITAELVQLGPAAFGKSEGGTVASTDAAQGLPAATSVDQSEQPRQEQQPKRDRPTEEQMVEYEGVLISAAAAQRRRFFSTLIQRAAKAHHQRGGGSLTLVMVLPGQPATGTQRCPRPPMAGYKHLSAEQRQKLEAALARQASGPTAQEVANGVRTEVVEEFMSIADGQTVLEGGTNLSKGVIVNAQQSVSRIGSRAFPPEFGPAAPQLRFKLAQASDMQRFGAEQQLDSNQRALAHAAVVSAALLQPPGQPASLAQEVVEMVALTEGILDDMPSSDVRPFLNEAVAKVRKDFGDANITTSKELSEDMRTRLLNSLKTLVE